MTLYDDAGGMDGLRALAAAWHARVLADEVVAHAFHGGVQPDHVERLASYWAEALGGPDSGMDETVVARMHAGNGEHAEMDERAIRCFDAALVDVGLEGIQGLHDYFASMVRAYAQWPESADDVPQGLSVPRWPTAVFQGLHHMQLCLPPGQEEAARSFYVGVLGMAEVAKPPVLAARGGAWFRSGGLELHLGVEEDFRPALKGHPGILVNDLDEVARRLQAAGQEAVWDGEFPGFRRAYAQDPFGNRLEFLQPQQ